VSLSDDGLVLVSTAFDGSTAVWNLSGAGALASGPVVTAAGGAPVATAYSKAALNADGSRLAVANTKQYEEWSVGDGSTSFVRVAGPQPVPGGDISSGVLTFDGGQVVVEPSPASRNDRAHLVVGVDEAGAVSVVDTRTAKTLGSVPARDHAATTVGLSPSGGELAVGRSDGTVERYAVPSMRPLGTVLGSHSSPVEQIAYQPQGQLIAIGSRSTVDLLDRSLGEIVATIDFAPIDSPAQGGAEAPSAGLGDGAVQFDATGRHLLTSGFEGNRPALVWSMTPAEWVNAACRGAHRNLTRAEWQQYIGGAYRSTCAQWPAG
jgi:WD40 repeat protein